LLFSTEKRTKRLGRRTKRPLFKIVRKEEKRRGKEEK
jgi:hypothetical protein